MRGFAEFFRLTEMADWAEFQQTPPELAFLRGDVDLGFENLGLNAQQQRALITAFQSDGVAVPGTAYNCGNCRTRQWPWWNLRLGKSQSCPTTGNRALIRSPATSSPMLERRCAATISFRQILSQLTIRAIRMSATDTLKHDTQATICGDARLPTHC